MTLEAVHLPQSRPSSAGLRAAAAGQFPGQLPARAVWKPATVSVTLPPWTAPTKVSEVLAVLLGCMLDLWGEAVFAAAGHIALSPLRPCWGGVNQ